MGRVFERFDLDLEKIASSSEIRLKIVPQKRELLRLDIHKKRFLILEGEHQYNGIPNTIIIGGAYGSGVKDDSEKIIADLSLPYTYIGHYFEITN
jgi:hypothetical protein